MGTANDFGAGEGVVLRKCLACPWGEGEAEKMAMELSSGEITQWDRIRDQRKEFGSALLLSALFEILHPRAEHSA